MKKNSLKCLMMHLKHITQKTKSQKRNSDTSAPLTRSGLSAEGEQAYRPARLCRPVYRRQPSKPYVSLSKTILNRFLGRESNITLGLFLSANACHTSSLCYGTSHKTILNCFVRQSPLQRTLS